MNRNTFLEKYEEAYKSMNKKTSSGVFSIIKKMSPP
jgi:hypothetical protein